MLTIGFLTLERIRLISTPYFLRGRSHSGLIGEQNGNVDRVCSDLPPASIS
jgi:alpha-D-ribose 1-methylphosphonate 5-triphosphate diphosphatase PhnM